jgi:hypothetical protein
MNRNKRKDKMKVLFFFKTGDLLLLKTGEIKFANYMRLPREKNSAPAARKRRRIHAAPAARNKTLRSLREKKRFHATNAKNRTTLRSPREKNSAPAARKEKGSRYARLDDDIGELSERRDGVT